MPTNQDLDRYPEEVRTLALRQAGGGAVGTIDHYLDPPIGEAASGECRGSWSLAEEGIAVPIKGGDGPTALGGEGVVDRRGSAW